MSFGQRRVSGQSSHMCTFPDCARRRKEAPVRNAKWTALSNTEKIASLDARLGTGVGAEKQRAKLSQPVYASNAEQRRADYMLKRGTVIGGVK